MGEIRFLTTAIGAIAAAATASSQAAIPFLSHTASGTGNARVGDVTQSDSNVTTDPHDPDIFFSASVLDPTARFTSAGHSQLETPPIGGLTLQWTASLFVNDDRLTTLGQSGSGDAQMSGVVELVMPSDEIEWTYSLNEEVLPYVGTMHLVVENVTQSQVMLDVTVPTAGTVPLAGVAGDVIRLSVESSASGASPTSGPDQWYRMDLSMQFTNVGDCDGNGVSDHQDVLDGNGLDCNQNGTLDSCDISSGASLDANTDGIPDECQGPPQKGVDDRCVGGANEGQPCAVHSDCPGGFCHLKNRFITVEVSPTVWNALKITLVNLDANSVQTPSNYNGTDRWVGPPMLMVNDGVSPPFNAAKTQCSFVSYNWSAIDRLHIYGDVIVPGSLYDLRGCSSSTTCSQALRVGTANFGDVIPPLNVVNFQDVNAELQKFHGAPAGPSKTRTKLAQSTLNLNTPINFQEIATCVSAFQSKKFKQVVTTPPVICP